MTSELNDRERSWLQTTGYHLDSELSEQQTSNTGLIPAAAATLRISRSAGLLFGGKATPYNKIGGKVCCVPRDVFVRRRAASTARTGAV